MTAKVTTNHGAHTYLANAGTMKQCNTQGQTVGKSIRKVITVKKNASVNILPIDFVAKTTLGATWHVTLHPNNGVKVSNSTNNV